MQTKILPATHNSVAIFIPFANALFLVYTWIFIAHIFLNDISGTAATML